jgi:hypothetical protein
MDWFGQLWAWLTVAPQVPEWWLVVPAAVVGVAGVAVPATWRATRLLEVYVHETGHALVGMVTGRRVDAIYLDSNGGGMTTTAGREHGLGRILTTFAGYPAPALAGLGIFVALSAGHARWAIAGAAVASGLLLLAHRSWRGLLVTGIILASATALAAAPVTVAAVALACVGGYLLAASPRGVIDLHRARRQARATGMPAHSDADTLAGLTLVPALIWELVFLAVCAVCFWWSVSMYLSAIA